MVHFGMVLYPVRNACFYAAPRRMLLLTQAKGAAPNENVLVDDLKANVSGAVRLMHGLSKPAGGVAGTRAVRGSLGGRDGLEVRIGSPSVNRSNSRPGSTSTSPKQGGGAYTHRCVFGCGKRLLP